MSARLERILDLLDNPTQHAYDPYGAPFLGPIVDEVTLYQLTVNVTGVVEAFKQLGEALIGNGTSFAVFLAACQPRRRTTPWKRNVHRYGR